MKLTFALFLAPLFFFSQKIVTVKLSGSVKDDTKTVKSFSVIDSREDKELGTIVHKKDSYRFEFANNDFKKSLEDYLYSYNKNLVGSNDLVFYIEDLKVFSDEEQGVALPKADLKVSSFILRNNNYYYLDRINKIISPNVNLPKTPLGLSVTITNTLADFIKNSYKEKPSIIAISQADLPNYANIIKKELAVFKDDQIKDGVYPTYRTFFNGEPMVGYELIKNGKNEVVRAKKGDERLPAYKMFAYVENGKMYHYTASGFLEMKKDEQGFYIFTNYGTLFPVQMNSTYGMFGLVGGIAGAIDANAKNKKLQKEEKYNIYIDALSGDYILK